jgi:hypothetical protein
LQLSPFPFLEIKVSHDLLSWTLSGGARGPLSTSAVPSTVKPIAAKIMVRIIMYLLALID